MQQTVTIAGRDVPVYPQRIGYLKNRVLRGLRDVQAVAAAGDFQVSDVDRGAYRLLALLMPNLEKYVPEHAFLGFATAEALEAGEYDPDADESPTIPELKAALTVACEASGLDLIGQLRGLVDPTWLRAVVTELLSEALEEQRSKGVLETSS